MLMNRTRRWSRAELLTGVIMVGAVWLIYQFEFKHWLGFTVGLAKWLRFDTVGGLVFMKDLDVTDNEIRQPQALRPPLKFFPTVIGNGRYEQMAFFLGGGFRAMLDMKSGFSR